MKLDILAIGAHPDDVEMSSGGTIAKEVAAGKKVGIIDLTRGELGTRGTPEIRHQEATEAAEILGVQVRHNLGLADGFFENNKTSQLKVIQMIRKYKPEVVLCNAIDDRHIDHAKGSDLASNACFLSGLRRITTSLDGEVQEAWRPKQVYHYIQWKGIEPDFVVDISEFMETKMKAVFAYKSQFYDPNSDEPETPISSKNATDSLSYRNSDMGRLVGVEAAEGFTVERYITVNSLFDLK